MGIEEGFEHKLHESYKIVPRDDSEGTVTTTKDKDHHDIEVTTSAMELAPLEPTKGGASERVRFERTTSDNWMDYRGWTLDAKRT